MIKIDAEMNKDRDEEYRERLCDYEYRDDECREDYERRDG
jgi:hypothetical protein